MPRILVSVGNCQFRFENVNDCVSTVRELFAEDQWRRGGPYECVGGRVGGRRSIVGVGAYGAGCVHGVAETDVDRSETVVRSDDAVSGGASGSDGPAVLEQVGVCDTGGGENPGAVGDGVHAQRDGRGGSGFAGVALRGPNYERNRQNRERKKQAKEARRAVSLESQELVERARAEEARRRLAAMGAEAARDDRRAQLADLKLDRMLRDERTKAKCYSAGLDHAAEVVRLVKLAASAAEHSKRQGLTNSCGWAETVASSAANSVARSSPSTSLASLASVASAGALAAKKGTLNDMERELVKWNPDNEAVVRGARSRVSRPLVYDDIVAAGSPFRLSDKDKRNLACVVAKMPIADDDRDYFY